MMHTRADLLSQLSAAGTRLSTPVVVAMVCFIVVIAVLAVLYGRTR